MVSDGSVVGGKLLAPRKEERFLDIPKRVAILKIVVVLGDT